MVGNKRNKTVVEGRVKYKINKVLEGKIETNFYVDFNVINYNQSFKMLNFI